MTSDTELDRALRADGREWRLRGVEIPDVAAFLPEEKARWRAPIWIAAAAALVVAAAAGLWPLLFASDSGPGRAQQVVTFNGGPSSQLLSGTVTAAGAPPPAPVGSPLCDQRAFHGVALPTRMASGTVIIASRLTYTGDIACSIRSLGPVVSLLDSSGRVVVSGDQGILIGTGTPYLEVKPGQIVRTGAQWASSCGGPAATIRFGLTGYSAEAGVDMPLDAGQPPTCGAAAGAITSFQPSVVDPGTPQSLITQISAPSSAQAGATLDYHVTLTNATNRAVALSPCPAYHQLLGATSGPSDPIPAASGQLNCAGAGGSIPAGASAQFAMRLDIPATETGALRLGWVLADATYTAQENAAFPTLKVTR